MIKPALDDAADAAGRPEPRIVASVPVCVTDKPDQVRQLIGALLAGYNELPSYRGVMDAEGAGGPADVSLVGSDDEVRAGLDDLRRRRGDRLRRAGVPDRPRRDGGDARPAGLRGRRLGLTPSLPDRASVGSFRRPARSTDNAVMIADPTTIPETQNDVDEYQAAMDAAVGQSDLATAAPLARSLGESNVASDAVRGRV